MSNGCDLSAFYASFSEQINGLVHSLDETGFQFVERSAALLPPHPDTELFIQLFERQGLPLPAALKEFYRRFGGINLSGRHAHWPTTEFPDPLWVEPLELIVEELQTEFLASVSQREWYQEAYGGFYFIIAPDYYHKEDVSGGEPYGVVLPTEANDPEVRGLPWKYRFTEYLNFAVSKGGFPGLGVLK